MTIAELRQTIARREAARACRLRLARSWCSTSSRSRSRAGPGARSASRSVQQPQGGKLASFVIGISVSLHLLRAAVHGAGRRRSGGVLAPPGAVDRPTSCWASSASRCCSGARARPTSRFADHASRWRSARLPSDRTSRCRCRCRTPRRRPRVVLVVRVPRFACRGRLLDVLHVARSTCGSSRSTVLAALGDLLHLDVHRPGGQAVPRTARRRCCCGSSTTRRRSSSSTSSRCRCWSPRS